MVTVTAQIQHSPVLADIQDDIARTNKGRSTVELSKEFLKLHAELSIMEEST